MVITGKPSYTYYFYWVKKKVSHVHLVIFWKTLVKNLLSRTED